MTRDQRAHVNAVKSQIVMMTAEQLLEVRELLELDLERMSPAQEQDLQKKILGTT